MKTTTTLALVSSLSCALAVPPAVRADLIGVVLQELPLATSSAREALGAAGVEGAANARVLVLYALFNDGQFGAEDQILRVEDADLELTNPRQRFFHSEAPSAGDTPPDPALFAAHPTLRFDTFVTISLITSTPLDTIELTPDTVLTDRAIRGEWFNADPDNMLGLPSALFGGDFVGTPIAHMTVLSECPFQTVFLDGVAVPISTGPVTTNPSAFTLDAPPITNIAGTIISPVDSEDLSLLLRQWGAADDCEPADFNADGVVDGLDLAMMLATWSGS